MVGRISGVPTITILYHLLLLRSCNNISWRTNAFSFPISPVPHPSSTSSLRPLRSRGRSWKKLSNSSPPSVLTTSKIQLTKNQDMDNSNYNPLKELLESLPFPGKVLSMVGNIKNENFNNNKNNAVVQSFLDAIEQKNMTAALKCIDEDCEYMDTAFSNPFVGKDAIRRHLYLSLIVPCQPSDVETAIVVDDMAVEEMNANNDKFSNDVTAKVCVMFHRQLASTTIHIPCSTTIAFFNVNMAEDCITKVFMVQEPADPKPGGAGLDLLKAASSILNVMNRNSSSVDRVNLPPSSKSSLPRKESTDTSTVVQRYFNAWNQRDMKVATDCFAPDCDYNDLQFPEPFSGKAAMKLHLERVASSLPSTFTFELDDMAVIKSSSSSSVSKVGVQWHVENNKKPLPFTRGASFYTTAASTQDSNGAELIVTGVDIPEPAVFKLGTLSLIWRTLQYQLKQEPIRIVPLITWVAYMYIVFLSDHILPGANALQLEQRTWEEVRDLSLNFFLVSPILHLPFAPVVHPMLEGVFNLLLSWAALFAMFLSDERKDKPNLFDLRPILVGMQFLTSAFLLPYLVFRNSEKEEDGMTTVYREDMVSHEITATVGEWRPLGITLGTVGTGSILWGLLARQDEFGATFAERFGSFVSLLSMDRVGSSFIVDLILFGLFQSWFVDDDMKRRGMNIEKGEMVILRSVAKYIPFFGMVMYSTLRPPLPSKSEDF